MRERDALFELNTLAVHIESNLLTREDLTRITHIGRRLTKAYRHARWGAKRQRSLYVDAVPRAAAFAISRMRPDELGKEIGQKGLWVDDVYSYRHQLDFPWRDYIHDHFSKHNEFRNRLYHVDIWATTRKA
jgi:hypothetical protein